MVYMAMLSWKSIIINTLYDTIEALGLCLNNSGSMHGRLAFQVQVRQENAYRVERCWEGRKHTGCLFLVPSGCGDAGARLFSELTATIKSLSCSAKLYEGGNLMKNTAQNIFSFI